MPDNDDVPAHPRHRKDGRATKRGSGLPGRHLRIAPVPDDRDVPPSTPGHYPVEDVAAMSASALEVLLHRARIEADSVAVTVPHVLITRDTETGVTTRSEPYTTGLEALRRASDFVDRYRDLEPRWDYTLTVEPVPTR